MPRHENPCDSLPRSVTRAAILSDYIHKFQRKLAAELQGFSVLTIGQIARARLGGQLMDHQHRLRRSVYPKAVRILQANEKALKSCSSFRSLHDMVDELFTPIYGAGPVYVYDTALRIGASVSPRLRPDVVYLHAGSRDGAERLKLAGARERPVTSFLAFASLEAHEIENLLCLYASCL